MARELGSDAGADASEVDDRRVVRSTSRALAAAFAGLLVTGLVVERSQDAITPDAGAAFAEVAAGTVAISDDDAGRSLISLTDMAPGRPSTSCIELTYEGTILPAELLLSAEATGALAAYLEVQVDRGRGASFGSCDGFVTGTTVYTGTLADLAVPVPAGTVRSVAERVSYRFTVELRDEPGAVGESATADLVWEVRPG